MGLPLPFREIGVAAPSIFLTDTIMMKVSGTVFIINIQINESLGFFPLDLEVTQRKTVLVLANKLWVKYAKAPKVKRSIGIADEM